VCVFEKRKSAFNIQKIHLKKKSNRLVKKIENAFKEFKNCQNILLTKA
jgi:hypothetical protein